MPTTPTKQSSNPQIFFSPAQAQVAPQQIAQTARQVLDQAAGAQQDLRNAGAILDELVIELQQALDAEIAQLEAAEQNAPNPAH
jgi:hypothetical protein